MTGRAGGGEGRQPPGRDVRSPRKQGGSFPEAAGSTAPGRHLGWEPRSLRSGRRGGRGPARPPPARPCPALPAAPQPLPASLAWPPGRVRALEGAAVARRGEWGLRGGGPAAPCPRASPLAPCPARSWAAGAVGSTLRAAPGSSASPLPPLPRGNLRSCSVSRFKYKYSLR